MKNNKLSIFFISILTISIIFTLDGAFFDNEQIKPFISTTTAKNHREHNRNNEERQLSTNKKNTSTISSRGASRTNFVNTEKSIEPEIYNASFTTMTSRANINPNVELASHNKQEIAEIDLLYDEAHSEMESAYNDEPSLELQFSETEPEEFGADEKEQLEHQAMLDQQRNELNEELSNLSEKAINGSDFDQRLKAIDDIAKTETSKATETLLDIANEMQDEIGERAFKALLRRLNNGTYEDEAINQKVMEVAEQMNPLLADKATLVLQAETDHRESDGLSQTGSANVALIDEQTFSHDSSPAEFQ